MPRMMMSRVYAEPDYINDIENTKCVNDEESNKPLFLAIASRMPKGVTLNSDSPNSNNSDNRDKCGD